MIFGYLGKHKQAVNTDNIDISDQLLSVCDNPFSKQFLFIHPADMEEHYLELCVWPCEETSPIVTFLLSPLCSSQTPEENV